ncbi:MAG: RrF2 family transcriptional regulator [Candidatus Binataceae bacterium]
MKFGVGVDYSLKALLMLAERYPAPEPLRVEEIAETQRIPENYLRRLMVEMKRGGLLLSQKGPSGGYLLARPPARISVEDVIQIVEGDYAPVECLVEGANGICRRDEYCAMRDMWREVQQGVLAILRRTTLQSLAQRRKGAISFQI